MALDRKTILGFKDSRMGRVTVEELGGEVCVASLTVAEADQIGKLAEGDLPAVAGIVILGACDEEGKRLFTQQDGKALSALPASALGKIAKAVLEHNGLTGGADEAAKNA